VQVAAMLLTAGCVRMAENVLMAVRCGMFGGHREVERNSSWQRQADGRKMRSVCIHLDGEMVRLYDVRWWPGGWMVDEVVERRGRIEGFLWGQ
jgi:hypothetical protein